MGAGESKISKTLQIGPAPLPISGKRWSGWERRDAVQYTTREKLSVFTFTAASDEQRTVWLPRMQQSVLRARTLRHPALLRYHGATIEGPNANTLVIVTERVLVSFADATPATLDPQEALLGLLNVVKALDFLHTTCQILHNNICAPSVFIVQDGSWRLGGFEFCLPMSDLGTAAFEGLDGAVDDVAPKAADAEEAEESVVIPHVRDVQALGRLAARIIASTSETDDSSVLSQLSELVEATQQSANVPIPALLLELDIFANNPFLQTVQSLNNFTLLDDQEKQQFFSTLATHLRQIDPSVIIRFIAPKLLTRIMILEPDSGDVMRAILTPRTESNNGIFHEKDFRRAIVPFLSTVWAKHQRQLRLFALHNFSSYVAALPQDLLRKHIAPELVVGLEDADDDIRLSSFCAACTLVPFLPNLPINAYQGLLSPASKPASSDQTSSSSLEGAKKACSAGDVIARLLPVFREIVLLSETPAEDVVMAWTAILDMWRTSFHQHLNGVWRPESLCPQLVSVLQDASAPVCQQFFSKTLWETLPQPFPTVFASRALVPFLAEFLLDPNAAVKESAYAALHRIVGVINTQPVEEAEGRSSWPIHGTASSSLSTGHRVSNFVDKGVKRQGAAPKAPATPISASAPTNGNGSGFTPSPTQLDSRRSSGGGFGAATDEVGFPSEEDAWEAKGWDDDGDADTTKDPELEEPFADITPEVVAVDPPAKPAPVKPAVSAEERKAKREAKLKELMLKRAVTATTSAVASDESSLTASAFTDDASGDLAKGNVASVASTPVREAADEQQEDAPVTVLPVPKKGMTLSIGKAGVQKASKASTPVKTAPATEPPEQQQQQPQLDDLFELVDQQLKSEKPSASVRSSPARGGLGGRRGGRGGKAPAKQQAPSATAMAVAASDDDLAADGAANGWGGGGDDDDILASDS